MGGASNHVHFFIKAHQKYSEREVVISVRKEIDLAMQASMVEFAKLDKPFWDKKFSLHALDSVDFDVQICDQCNEK